MTTLLDGMSRAVCLAAAVVAALVFLHTFTCLLNDVDNGDGDGLK
jgi:hypothetical protein